MKLLKTKKGNISAVIGFVIGLMIIAIITSIALYTNSKVGDKMTAGSAAATASAEMTDEIAEVPGWIGILVVAFFGILIIGLFLGMRYMGQQ